MKIEKPKRFVLAFYIVAIVCVILFDTLNLCSDFIGRATGSIKEVEYNFSTLEENECVEVTDAYNATSVGEDAQLIINNLETRAVSVQYNITFNKYPGEVTLYYKKAGEEYSSSKKIYGKAKSDGTYSFALPPLTQIDGIRIDPTNVSGVTMHINSFTLNKNTGALSYYALTYSETFYLLICPGLAAAIIGYLIQSFGEKINIKRR